MFLVRKKWGVIMDHLGDLDVFARVVTAKGMSAAGRELNLSPAVISKRIRRLEERLGVSEAALVQSLATVPSTELDGGNGSHEVWALVLEAARLDDVIEQVIRTLEFSVLAKWAFSLAQSFSGFYHAAHILKEERDDVRRWRAAAVIYVRAQLTRALDLMAIEVPARM